MYEVILVCLLVVMVEGMEILSKSTFNGTMWGCEGEEEGTAMNRKPGTKDF